MAQQVTVWGGDSPLPRSRPEPEAPWWYDEGDLLDRIDGLHAELAALLAEQAAEPVEAPLAEPTLLADPVEAPSPVEAWQLDDAGLLAELAVAQEAVSRAHSRWLGLLGDAERRGSVVAQHSMPTASWLAAGSTHSTRAARSDVRLASQLEKYPHVAAGLADGWMSLEQATAIITGLEKLPGDFNSTELDAIEVNMVTYAESFNATALRHLVNRAVEAACPDVADEHNRRLLEQAEREQQRTKHLAWRTDPNDGSLRFWGKLPALDGELFKQHLSAIAATQRAADALMGVDTTRAQALTDALALVLAHHASCDGGPVKGGDHTRVLVTLTLEHLLTGVGVGTLVEGEEKLSAGQVRRLACTAGIIPIVLGGDSVPLDLGRTQRLFTPAQRVALAVRDGGCAFPGCDRPPADCEAHHITPWHNGGLTDLSQGVLLCPHHHHLIEPDPARPPEHHWQITFDARGKPIFHSPLEANGQRTTRQHHRYRM